MMFRFSDHLRRVYSMKLFFSIALLTFSALWSEPLKQGESLGQIGLLNFSDQHGNIISLPEKTRFVVFASDMEASKIAHAFFNEKKEAWMKEKQVVFLSDIHKMPSLITKYVAVPKMKSYPYPILLIQDDSRGQFFPKTKGNLTVLSTKELTILSISFINTEKNLIKTME